MFIALKDRIKQSKNEVRNIVSFGAVEGLARALNWCTMVLLPLILQSTAEYGLVGLIVSLEVFAANFLLMGQERAILRFYANDKFPETLVTSVLVILSALVWIPFAILLVFLFTGKKLIFGIPIAPHLILLSFSIAIFNLNIICVCISRVQHDVRYFLRFRICYVAVKFIFVLFIAAFLKNCLSYIIGTVLAGLSMLFFIFPFLRQKIEFKYNPNVIIKLAVFGWPLLFLAVSGNILNYLNRFFLQTYNDINDVGVFTFAFTIGNGLYFLYAALNIYFEPRIYSYAENKERNEKWLSYYTNACLALSAAGGIFLIILFPYFISYFPKGYETANAIIPIILAGVLLQPLYLQGNYRLTIYRKTGQIAFCTICGGLLNIFLCILFIPPYGIWGAATAFYAASFCQTTLIFIISMYVGRIKPVKQMALQTYLICSLCSIAIAFASKNFSILFLIFLFAAALGILFKLFINRRLQIA